MKKRILTLALAIMLAVSVAVPAFAAPITAPGDGTAELTYTVASTYSVTIPVSTISVSKAESYASLGTVTVAPGMLLDVGKTLTVKLYSTNVAESSFNLVLSGDTSTKVAYSIQKNDGEAIAAASTAGTAATILSVTAGTITEQTAQLQYKITGTAIKSGSFTDTLTFVVGVA